MQTIDKISCDLAEDIAIERLHDGIKLCAKGQILKSLFLLVLALNGLQHVLVRTAHECIEPFAYRNPSLFGFLAIEYPLHKGLQDMFDHINLIEYELTVHLKPGDPGFIPHWFGKVVN